MNTNQLAEELGVVVAGLDRPAAVAISGPAALGKSTVAAALARCLDDLHGLRTSIISTDGFLMDREHRQQQKLSGYDPAAMDIKRLSEAVETVLTGQPVLVPAYNHANGRVVENARQVVPHDVVIVDGIHSFAPRSLRQTGCLIFFESDQQTAVNLRCIVDAAERGYSVEGLRQMAILEHQVYERYVAPDRELAHVTVWVSDGWQYRIQGEPL